MKIWNFFNYLLFSALMLVIGFLIGTSMCDYSATEYRYIVIVKDAQIEKNVVIE